MSKGNSRSGDIPNYYYFYLDDADWGECFLKVCSYAPWGLKLSLNGHEWLKRQLAKQGIGFEALDNGFLSCEDPQALQQLAHSLGSQHVQAFLSKWLDRLPLPLSAADRQAGYDLRRLLRKGLLWRAEHSQRYYLTPSGWKLARLYARLEARVFPPALTAMNGPPMALPGKLKEALAALDAQLDLLIDRAFPERKIA